MSRLKPVQARAQADAQIDHRPQHDGRRCYRQADVIALLQLAPSTFHALRRSGRLPFLEELQPRLGRSPRFRADLIDRYLAGQWGADVRALRRRA